jgi:hypothetical protein
MWKCLPKTTITQPVSVLIAGKSLIEKEQILLPQVPCGVSNYSVSFSSRRYVIYRYNDHLKMRIRRL